MTLVTNSSDALPKTPTSLWDKALNSLSTAAEASLTATNSFSGLLSKIATTVSAVSAAENQASAAAANASSTQDSSQSSFSSTSSGSSNSSVSSSSSSDHSSDATHGAQGNNSSSTSSSTSTRNSTSNSTSNATTSKAQLLEGRSKSKSQQKSASGHDTSSSSADKSASTVDNAKGIAVLTSLPVLSKTDQTAPTETDTASSTSSTTETALISVSGAQAAAALFSSILHGDKKIVPGVNGPLNAGTSTPTATTSQIQPQSSTGSSSKEDIKNALDALKNAADQTAANGGNGDAALAGETSGAAALVSSASTRLTSPSSASSPSVTPAVSLDSVQNSDAKQLDLINFLNAVPSTQAAASGTTTFTALDPTAGTSVQEVSSASANEGQGGGNASSVANNSANAANAGSSAASTKSTSPYSFASQLTAVRTPNTGLSTAVEQVSLQLNRKVKGGNDEMTIQLNPTDLGRVNIKLDITSDGKVTGMVTADNQSTLDMLSKDSRSLERSLQDAGFQADSGSLQFSMSGQSGNTSGQTGNSSSGNGSTLPPTGQITLTDPLPTGNIETYYITPTGVNLSV